MRYKKEKESELVRCCAFCERASVLTDEDHILCEKKGVVAQSFRCRRFVYDPTKREPHRMPQMPTVEFPDSV